MKKAFVILFLAPALLSAQNQVKSSGVTYSAGFPTWVPVEKSGSEINIDTATGRIYQWQRLPGASNAGSWLVIGQGIDTLNSSGSPAYAPFRNQSWFVANSNNELYRYSGTGTSWNCMNCGLSATVLTDQTLEGDGSVLDPLKLAQQSASSAQQLSWSGATWEPSWGNPYTYVTSGTTISTDINEVLIGTVSGDVTMGLPTCNSANDSKHFKFVRNGSDAFSLTIDPAGAQLFYDGSSTKILYGKISIDCTCRFSSGTGTWFFDNL